MTQTKQLTDKQIDAYINKNQLDKIIDFRENSDYRQLATDTVSGSLTIPFPPEKPDLVRLHHLIRQRKAVTVLEFGVGYSTPIIADALDKNRRDWEKLANKPVIRNRFMFQLFSVDASKKWIAETKKRLPARLSPLVTISYRSFSIGPYHDQLCHYYDRLPDVVPDFIYVDAPDTKQVKNMINGLSFQCDERTVMSADLLLMEPILLPGTFILIDGRTNNARFLARNWQRHFTVNWDKKADITTMELVEEKLGKFNESLLTTNRSDNRDKFGSGKFL